MSRDNGDFIEGNDGLIGAKKDKLTQHNYLIFLKTTPILSILLMNKYLLKIMTTIAEFFNSPFFIIVGGLSTVLMIFGFLYAAYLVVRGVFPVWYRLGVGLSKSTIAVFASNEFGSLKAMLADSKIFKGKNIIQINKNDIKKAGKAKVFLVHWKEFQENITDILRLKRDNVALIIYAPQSEGKIEDGIINSINSHRNAIIVNFRGRLMNDIFTSLVTANYDQ